MLKPPLQPMLLSSKKEAFNSSNYIFEFKWDGYRCLCFIDKKKIYMQSRNKKSLNRYFSDFDTIIKNLNCKNAILDGELCYLDQDGKANFSMLQKKIRYKQEQERLSLIAWDLISYNGRDISSKPLIERKKLLESIVKKNNTLIISPFIRKYGVRLFQEARKEKIEGIVAKKINSPYEFRRSKFWYKIKCWQYTEVIITAYTGDHHLYVAKEINNNLVHMGKVKLSLEKNVAETLFEFLPTIKIKNPPYDINLKDAHWVKPAIKGKIRYTEITAYKSFRHGYIVDIII